MCCSLPVVSSPVLNLARDRNDDGSAADLNIKYFSSKTFLVLILLMDRQSRVVCVLVWNLKNAI